MCYYLKTLMGWKCVICNNLDALISNRTPELVDGVQLDDDHKLMTICSVIATSMSFIQKWIPF
jgi:hypothetical protein